MLKRQILDNLWQSGFCKDLIELLRKTPVGPTGSATRIEITNAHLQDGCIDCRHATAMREVEHRTAMVLGETAIEIYNRGGDIRSLPGFTQAFKKTMDAGIAVGKIDKSVLSWLTRVVPERAGKSYPYHEEDDGSQTN
jgi:hypothetical protein